MSDIIFSTSDIVFPFSDTVFVKAAAYGNIPKYIKAASNAVLNYEHEHKTAINGLKNLQRSMT